MVEYLKTQAMRLIRKAQSQKDAGIRTEAQHDSYGAVIFYNGSTRYSLIAEPGRDVTNQSTYIETAADAQGGRHKGWTKGGIPEGTGTEWAKMLRDELKTGAWEIPKKGFCLVVFNAAFYSYPLEKGETSTGIKFKRKYNILSMIVDDMRGMESQFKGSKLRLHGLREK